MARLLCISLIAFVLTTATAQASPLGSGTTIKLRGTPHLWIADDQGTLHWAGDTRALAGKHVNWGNQVEVSIEQLRALPIGDPWLSAGLLKDGDPIYLVKWETAWTVPKLLHIQSLDDVSLFGINGSNYGRFVLDVPTWEARYGLTASGLERQALPSAVSTTLPPPPPAPPPAPPTPPVTSAPPDNSSEWIYTRAEDELTGEIKDNIALFADDFGMALMIRCKASQIWEGLVGVTEEWEPLPGGPQKRLQAYYRFDDDPIKQEWWGSAVKQNVAFIPHVSTDSGLLPFIERLISSTRLVIRVVNYKGVEYTGVFNTTGSQGPIVKLLNRCDPQ